MSEHITEERPVARKHHECFHCTGSIVPGEQHREATIMVDGIHTLRVHDDCDKLLDAYMRAAQLSYGMDFPEGVPPLHELFAEDDFDANCAFFRGHFPHAVTRIELGQQKAV